MKLDNIVWLFIKIEFICSNAGMLASLIKVRFDHLQERYVLALSSETKSVEFEEGCRRSGDFVHFNRNKIYILVVVNFNCFYLCTK